MGSDIKRYCGDATYDFGMILPVTFAAILVCIHAMFRASLWAVSVMGLARF
jgi:hypothetical protein